MKDVTKKLKGILSCTNKTGSSRKLVYIKFCNKLDLMLISKYLVEPCLARNHKFLLGARGAATVYIPALRAFFRR